ncbi:MAG: hypothetical protein KC548_05575 [Nanoarchaeota archaeon]|nr:hypothetical protein [Nanoarchaeota archaeon]
MKVLVTGNSGSGNSTLGKKLSQRLNLPYYGLDKIVWQKNWVPTPRDERLRLIKEITDTDAWLIEGVSKLALKEADKVYFLDLPLYRCLINIVKRFIKNGLGTREGLPLNCPEYIGVIKAIKIAFLYEKVTKPWLLEELSSGKVIRIKRHEDLKELQ